MTPSSPDVRAEISALRRHRLRAHADRILPAGYRRCADRRNFVAASGRDGGAYAQNLAAYYAALTVGSHNCYEGRTEADVTPFVAYFREGMADAFAKVLASAARGTATVDRSARLRDLDPRQRRLLELFRAQGSATASEMAAHLKMSPRTLVQSSRDWIAGEFLEYQNAARKNRSYRLGARFFEL